MATNSNINHGIQNCEEWFCLTLEEVTDSFGVSKETILEIINEGIIELPSGKKNEWQFKNTDIGRIRTVLQLQHDLNINLAGSALILDLLAEIDSLHQTLNKYKF